MLTSCTRPSAYNAARDFGANAELPPASPKTIIARRTSMTSIRVPVRAKNYFWALRRRRRNDDTFQGPEREPQSVVKPRGFRQRAKAPSGAGMGKEQSMKFSCRRIF
jgi:hypothetical protein